ncbi:Ig-like domain-containing protein, partial [Bacteroidota bacterium]
MKKITLTLLSAVLFCSMVLSQHFVPVWDGNGYDHMNIYIFEATIDGIDLEIGDEIAVFDGDSCVGASTVSIVIDVDNPLQVIASKDDDDGDAIVNGFENNNSIIFKIWDASEMEEITNLNPIYTTGLGKFIGSGSASLTLEANSPNIDPSFTSTPIITASEDVAYTYDIAVDDPNTNDVIKITAPILPPWLKLTDNGDGTATIAGTPGDLAVGTNDVELNATDGVATATQSFTITVANQNDVPVFTSIPFTVVLTSGSYTYNITATDADGDNITFELNDDGGATWLSLDQSVSGEATLSGTAPSGIAEYNITIFAVDGTGSSAQYFTLKVTDSNTPPTITSTARVDAVENQLYKYTITADDEDEGTNLIFGSTTLPGWTTLVDNGDGTALLSGIPLITDRAGDNSVSINVTDGIETTNHDFTITVSATTNAPAIITTTLNTASQDVPYTMTVNLQDVDSDSLFVTLTKKPAWLTFDNGESKDTAILVSQEGSVTLSGTPTSADVRTSQVILVVSDKEFDRTSLYALVVTDLNDAPVAIDANQTVREDKQAYVTLQGLDKESPNSLVYSIYEDPQNGTLEPLSVNLFIYSPDLNFFGTDSFKFIVEDADGLKDTGMITLQVTAVNDAPEISISNRKLEMFENDTLSFIVTLSDANDGANAADLEAKAMYGPFNGTLEGDFEAGFLEYIPNEDFVGTDVVFLVAQEDHADSLKSKLLLIQILVKNVNSPPVAFDRNIIMPEDHFRKFRVFAFDREDDIFELTITAIEGPSHADSFSITGNQVYYQPTLNYDKTDTIVFEVSDTEGGKDTAIVSIYIVAKNDRPIVSNDSIDAGSLSSITIDFTSLVSDAESHDSSLVITFISGNNQGLFGGTLTQGSHNLEFNFTQDNTYNIEYIIYRAIDEDLMRSKPGLLVIENLLYGTAPAGSKSLKAGSTVASGDSIGVNLGETVELNLVGLDLNPPFDSCSFAIIEGAQHGTLSLNKGLKAAYTPGQPVSSSSALYSPATSDDQIVVDRIKFKATNTDGTSDTAEIVIGINVSNDDPNIADLDNQQVNEDDSIQVTLSYEDLDSDPGNLNWSLSSPGLANVGYRYFNQTATEISLTISPPADYEGNAMILARVEDETSLSDSIEFVLDVANVNDAPDLADIQNQTTIQGADISILLLGSDIDSDTLTYTAVSRSQVAIDTIIFEDNEMTVSPSNAFNGTDTIDVTVTDNADTPASTTKSFILHIALDDDAPQFNTTFVREDIDEDGELTIQITPIDSKTDELLTVTILSSNQNLIPDDSISVDEISAVTNTVRTLNFVPVGEESGETKITMYIDDEEGNQTIQQFNLYVNEVNDAPVLDPIDALTMNEDYIKAISLSGEDVDSYDLTFDASSDNDNIEVAVDNNLLTITALNDYYGSATIKVFVTDANSTDSASVSLTVSNIQDEPSFTTGRELTAAIEDEAYLATIQFSDPDPDTWTLTEGTGFPSWLTIGAISNQSFTVSGTPTNDDVGQLSFDIELSDGTDSDIQTFRLVVANVNDAPTITSSPKRTATAGTRYSYSITTNDIDAGDVVALSAPTKPSWLSLSGNTLSGTPSNSNASNTNSVTLRATDGEATATQSFSITVTPTTSISNNEFNASIQIYPNPSDGIFDIELSNAIKGLIEVNVYNIQGQLVYEEDFVKIN